MITDCGHIHKLDLIDPGIPQSAPQLPRVSKYKHFGVA